jgi:hypothetical protein
MACCATHSCRAARTARAAGRMERSACPTIACIATTSALAAKHADTCPARVSKATVAAAAAAGGIHRDAGAVVLHNTSSDIHTAAGPVASRAADARLAL